MCFAAWYLVGILVAVTISAQVVRMVQGGNAGRAGACREAMARLITPQRAGVQCWLAASHACQSRALPAKALRSTFPAIPGTWPVPLYCQNVQLWPA